VGYTGGTTANPDYNNIGNHSETVQVDYDPEIVSYAQLLAVFWNSHDVTSRPYSMQYRSAIFYTTDLQRSQAEEFRNAEEARLGTEVYTSIEQAAVFYVAEDYHQKYYLRLEDKIVNELYAIYPDPAAFRDSTAAARLNGYAGGFGDAETLSQNLEKFGLSSNGRQALLKLTESGLGAVCPVVIPGG
jgi:peptide-methionine (S)-S-oxide reductase